MKKIQAEIQRFEQRSFVRKLVTLINKGVSKPNQLSNKEPSLKTLKFCLYFSGSCISLNPQLSPPTLAQTAVEIISITVPAP